MSTAIQPSPSHQPFLQKRSHNRNQPDWRAFYANGVPDSDDVIVISDDEENNANYGFSSSVQQIIPQPLTNQHHHNDSSSSTSSSLSITTAMTSTTNSSNENPTIKYSKLPECSKRLRKYSSSGTFSDQIVEMDGTCNGTTAHQHHHHHPNYYDEYNSFNEDYEYNQYDEDSPYCTEYSMIESTESITSGSIILPLTGTARSSLTRTSSSIASNGLLTGKKKRKRVSRKDANVNNYLDDQRSHQLPVQYQQQHLLENQQHSQFHGQPHYQTRQQQQLQNYPRPLLTPPIPIRKPSDVDVPSVIDKTLNLDVADDKDGHFIVKIDTLFADNRYQILKLLGQGTFGKVVSVYDKKLKTYRAIKIIRAVEKYREASRIELRVLMTLAMYDEQNIHQCIHLRDCFDYKNHICIVTDLLGISIFDFMKSNNFLPFPGSHVQSFAYQLLKSVSFLHYLNLVHTDLKPENILLSNSEAKTMQYRKGRTVKKRNVLNSTTINLIDFGSAIFNDEHHSSVVSTRHYRAPEIILGVGWSFPCDIWSIGCILVELCTGEALFQTHDNLEHLALMQKVIGEKLDPVVIQRIPSKSPARSDFINKSSNSINYPNPDVEPGSVKYVESVKTFDQLIQSSVPYYARDKAFWTSFLDLLHKIFVYDANKRITAREALEHPWFQKVINDDGINSHLQHRQEYQSTSQTTTTRSYNRRQRL